MFEVLLALIAFTVGIGFYQLAKYAIKKIRKIGDYTLKCAYLGCDFRISVSDEKYSYICDDLMADHQNRQHPLEFKEIY